MSFFIREFPEPRKEGKDFQILPAGEMRVRFGQEVEIFPSDAAAELILAHPDCPFRSFSWSGECEIDLQKYYIAANGPIFHDATQIILLEK